MTKYIYFEGAGTEVKPFLTPKKFYKVLLQGHSFYQIHSDAGFERLVFIDNCLSLKYHNAHTNWIEVEVEDD